MYPVVIKGFKHKNTGRKWKAGDVFEGTEAQSCELARRGYVEFVPGAPPGAEPEPAPAPAPAAEAAPTRDELEAMTVKQLVALCVENRIETPSKPRKGDLVAALALFFAESADEPGGE